MGYNLFDLQGIQVYKKLAWLNELPADEAEYVFGECCGSGTWAQAMAAGRPFAMLEHLFSLGEASWNDLPADEKVTYFADGGWAGIEDRLAKLLER